MTIRVLVADDQALVRAGLVALLNAAPGMTPIGEAADGVEAIALVDQHEPDVVLMDIRMPVLDGIAATRQILDRDGPVPRIIVLTTFDLDEYVYAALAQGAAGFLLKDTPTARILAAIETVVSGDVLIAPQILRRLVENHAPRRSSADARLDRLTPREREVLVRIANGSSNTDIAAALVISQETVKTHVKRLTAKLDLTSRAQAVVFAYESGLVVAGRPPV